ncbi:DUF2851 family protein [Aureitalea sp. L0-47]|uniref:DUF2851 family protein n=1 Tax=Aureitalea sp. L0-47 TaxID=2816962 RepID=UPI002238CFE2|nr:DUF2851 family protein [Aureitalea sp. L0-47]MCW5520678.1 DUF2851 family protein [Aureitalea sp. L0-47]
MKEEFLQYVWKFRKFDTSDLRTTLGDSVEVITPGLHNLDSGPDFFNGAVRIGDQQWAGNIEVHILSSLWYAHEHQDDPAYDNVVLHVVWLYDRPVFRRDNTEIPTIELQNRVPALAISNYQRLYSGMHRWIPCEADFSGVDDFIYKNWLDALFIERMEQRTDRYVKVLHKLKNDWEALLFRELCVSFGTRVNKDSFISIADSVDFSLVRKLARENGQLEVMLLGQALLLEDDSRDEGYLKFRNDYLFLKRKFRLNNSGVILPKFFRLRPNNFPTIRLSQLADLYEKRPRLFSDILDAETLEEYYKLFDATVSTYWEQHFTFGKEHKSKSKPISAKFKDHLLINVVMPLKFYYLREMGSSNDEELLSLAERLPPEKNRIISNFERLGRRTGNMLESQGLLQLKNEYCTKKRCLRCRIGNEVLGK